MHVWTRYPRDRSALDDRTTQLPSASSGARPPFSCAGRARRRLRRRPGQRRRRPSTAHSIDEDRLRPLDERRGQVQRPGADAAVPEPPDYAACVARSARRRRSRPRASRRSPTRSSRPSASRSTTRCATRCCSCSISFQWIEGEAKDQGIKVTDAEVKKSFDTAEEAGFPKDADYQKFLKDSGQTEADILQRVRLDLLSNKIRDKVIKGKDKVTDAQIEDYYNKNKARFAQPERRDLRDRPDQGQGQGRRRPRRRSRAASRGSRSPRSTRSTRPPRRRAASCPRRRQGPAGEGARRRRSSTPRRASSSGRSRPSSATTSSRSTRSRRPRSSRSTQAKTTIKQTLASQNQQKALDTFVKDFRKSGRRRRTAATATRRRTARTRPKADADADRRRAAAAQPAAAAAATADSPSAA